MGRILPILTAQIADNPRTDWCNTIETLRRDWQERMAAETTCDSGPISPQFLVRTLQDAVDPHAVIALDVGDHFVWFARVYEARYEDVLISGRWRSMGFGLPAAITAKLRHPERQVVAFTGDGGFAMVMAELATVVQLCLPITIVVVNNQVLAMELNRMVVGNYRPVGVNLHNPNFADFARSVGCLGWRVEHPADLAPALREALSANQPALVDVLTANVIAPGTKV